MPYRFVPSARRRRRRRSVALALVLVTVSAAQADAASVEISQPCQLATLGLTASLSGFAPNATVTLTGESVMRTAQTDAVGNAIVRFSAPMLGTMGPASRQFIVTASDGDGPAAGHRAFTRFRVANLAFSTAGGLRSPRAPRVWQFSGLQPGRPVFGHFRYARRTRATYRFGAASRPCGELKVEAPGIPVRGRINTGRWSIQIDQKRTFSPRTTPRLTGGTKVVVVYAN